MDTRFRAVVGLVRAAHPGPTIAVTTVATLLAYAGGRSGGGLLAVAAAVGTGQLSVGWSNDAHDAPVDIRAERTDKPIVAGEVVSRVVWCAAGAALTATAVLSVVAAGWFGGTLHLAAVGLAWAYNLRISRTGWSFVPYVLAFALLPAFITYASEPPSPPAAWVVVGFAAMGLGAHLLNGLRDLDVDRRSGLDGAVVRTGARRGRLLAALAFVVAGAAVGVGLRDARPLLAVAVPVVSVAVLVPTVWLAPPRWAFRAVLVAAVGLVLVLVSAALAGELAITA